MGLQEKHPAFSGYNTVSAIKAIHQLSTNGLPTNCSRACGFTRLFAYSECGCTCAMWGVRGQPGGVGSLLLHLGPGDQTQVFTCWFTVRAHDGSPPFRCPVAANTTRRYHLHQFPFYSTSPPPQDKRPVSFLILF